MSQPPIAPAASGQFEGSPQIMGPWSIPRMFLDPTMNTFMARGAPTQTTKDKEDVPSARSYGTVAKDEITLQTMLDEKKDADDKLKEKYRVKDEASTTRPPPPEARMAEKPRSRETLDLLVRSPLDYSSLTSSITRPHPEVEAVKEFLDDEEEIPDENDDVSELDETTICQTEEGLIGSCNTPTECAMVSGLPS